LVCLRKLLASFAEGAFEDIIIAAPTDSNNTQNHTPNHILQMDIHFKSSNLYLFTKPVYEAISGANGNEG
jgi:hypothetical protein